MKALKAGLLLIVGGIILLHTLVPHEHFTASANVAFLSSPTCEANLFRGIQLSFGLDHGTGHFEHYVDSDQLNIDFALPSRATEISVFILPLLRYNGSLEHFPTKYTPFRQLRGPPTV